MALDPTNVDLSKYPDRVDRDTMLLVIIAYCLVNGLAAGAAKTNLLTQLSNLVNTLPHI